jgi:hypothetical protein
VVTFISLLALATFKALALEKEIRTIPKEYSYNHAMASFHVSFH